MLLQEQIKKILTRVKKCNTFIIDTKGVLMEKIRLFITIFILSAVYSFILIPLNPFDLIFKLDFLGEVATHAVLILVSFVGVFIYFDTKRTVNSAIIMVTFGVSTLFTHFFLFAIAV